MHNVGGMTCFISGPMSGIDNYNVGKFADAHATLKLLEAAYVYDPALEWLLEPLELQGTYDAYLYRCLNELTKMDDNGEPWYDCLVQLEGWDESHGAMVEALVAKACGIEVFPIEEAD